MHAVLQLSCVWPRKWNVVLFFFPQRFFLFLELSGDQAFKHSLRLAAVCWVSVCQWPPSLSQVACEWQKARIAQIFRTVVFVWSQEHVLALTFLKTDDNGTAVTKKSLRKADWRVIGFFFSPNFFAFFLAKQEKKRLLFQNISSITPTGMSLCHHYSLDLQYFSHQLFGWTLITLNTWL